MPCDEIKLDEFCYPCTDANYTFEDDCGNSQARFEPKFVLRASDRHAMHALSVYYTDVNNDPTIDRTQKIALANIVNAFENYQVVYGTGTPIYQDVNDITSRSNAVSAYIETCPYYCSCSQGLCNKYKTKCLDTDCSLRENFVQTLINKE